jgi:hypothetical protein
MLGPFVWVFMHAGWYDCNDPCFYRLGEKKLFNGLCTVIIVGFKFGSSGHERISKRLG